MITTHPLHPTRTQPNAKPPSSGSIFCHSFGNGKLQMGLSCCISNKKWADIEGTNAPCCLDRAIASAVTVHGRHVMDASGA